MAKRMIDPDNLTEDDVINLAEEIVRVRCAAICDDVDGISGWDGDPTDTEKRYKAGVSMACEEIKFRINALDLDLRKAARIAEERITAGPTLSEQPK